VLWSITVRILAPLAALLCPAIALSDALAGVGKEAVGEASGADAEARRKAEEQAFGHARPVTGRERIAFVAFTFDDGPHHATTPVVLEALEAHEVPATFFVVGRRFSGRSQVAKKNAEVLADLVARGFTVGNHTYEHRNLRTQNRQTTERAIERGARAIERVLGHRPYLFRAPFGSMTGRARSYLRGEGYTEVGWNIDSYDYQITNARRLRQAVVRQILRRQGGVVLLHDTKKATAAAVPGILADLEAENCRRREAGESLIVPVSLHYFLKNRDGSARPIPPEVEARTRAYLQRLAQRCRRVDKNLREN
jgi:peptidoglycan-N-acetylglucosamine deacetylase